MKIKITRDASNVDWWYGINDIYGSKIGNVYDVTRETEDSYYVKFNGWSFYVLKEDCEIVKEDKMESKQVVHLLRFESKQVELEKQISKVQAELAALQEKLADAKHKVQKEHITPGAKFSYDGSDEVHYVLVQHLSGYKFSIMNSAYEVFNNGPFTKEDMLAYIRKHSWVYLGTSKEVK